MTSRTRYCARSTSLPVSSPVAGSSSIAPPPGATVSLVTCASASARLLAIVTCAPKPIDDRMVGRRRVELLAARKALFRHAEILHRAAGADDPGAGRHFARLRPHHFENVRDRAHVRAEVADIDLVERRGAVVGEMDMRIGEAGNDGAAPSDRWPRSRAPRSSSISPLSPTARMRPILTATASNVAVIGVGGQTRGRWQE